MKMGDIVGLVFAFSLIAFIFIGIPLGVYLDIRKERKQQELDHEKNVKWLKSQLRLPRYCLAVVTKCDAETIFSKPFEPHISVIWENQITSKFAAETQARIISRGGPYYHIDNIYYPHHEIVRVEVIEDPNPISNFEDYF